MATYLNQPKSAGFRNTYQSQFVPLPLEQFARAGEKAQRTQDGVVNGLEGTTDELWKLKGIAKEDNERLAEIKGTFENTAKELAGLDLTKKENQDKAKALVKNVARDKDLETINYNYSQYQQYLKDTDDMKKQGTYQAYNDEFAPQYDEYSKKGGYKSGKRLASNIFKYEDVRPTQEQFFNDMQKTGSDVIKQVAGVYYKDGATGITADRIGKQAMASLEGYLQTPAAQQEGRAFDYLAKSGAIPKKSNGKEMSKLDYIYGNLLSAGMEREGITTTTNRDDALNTKRKEDREDAKEKAAAFSFGTMQTQGAAPIATGGYSFDFKEDGSIKGEGQPWSKVWDQSEGVFDFIKKAWNDDSFNMASEKDQKGFQLQAAAKLNGMKASDYVSKKAGPDVKLSTTFIDLQGKEHEAANKKFYDMTRKTGIFNNVPVMDITTGAKGSMVEILRQLSEEGELKNSKGETIEISDNPTTTEIAQLIKETGMGIIGKQDPNYHSAKAFVIGVGGRNISMDMTYGGTQLNDVPLEAQKRHKYEQIKASGSIIEKDKSGVDYIHWFNEKSGQIEKTKLKDLKD